MFSGVWRWAGRYRMTQKSIGIEPYRIGPELRNLLADTDAWMRHQVYPVEELAARFHHRLVFIHAFENGNGRHARLATDLLCEQNGWGVSNWGYSSLVEAGESRRKYIAALRAADQRDLNPLIRFMALDLPVGE